MSARFFPATKQGLYPSAPLMLTLIVILSGMSLPVQASAQEVQAASFGRDAGSTLPEKPEAAKKKKKKKKKKGWKANIGFNVGGGYDSNVFRLTKLQKSLLEAGGPDEAASRRFRDMNDASDFIITPGVNIGASGPGIGGRKMSLDVKAKFDIYQESDERNNIQLGVSLRQAVSENGRIGVELEFTPSYFQRNYLTDAVDADFDGSISPAERVYSRGTYSAWDILATYRHRTGKYSNAWLGAGYRDRTYDGNLFPGRDRTSPHVDAGLTVGGKGKRFKFSARLMAVDALRTQEVLILDEPLVGVDLNGDSDDSDLQVRTLQSVDRTHTQLRFRVEAQFGSPKRTHYEVRYQHRRRHFSSHEPLDLAHNGRDDTRDTFRVTTTHRLAKPVRLKFGYFLVTQGIGGLLGESPANAAGEILDFNRMGFNGQLKIRF